MNFVLLSRARLRSWGSLNLASGIFFSGENALIHSWSGPWRLSIPCFSQPLYHGRCLKSDVLGCRRFRASFCEARRTRRDPDGFIKGEKGGQRVTGAGRMASNLRMFFFSFFSLSCMCNLDFFSLFCIYSFYPCLWLFHLLLRLFSSCSWFCGFLCCFLHPDLLHLRGSLTCTASLCLFITYINSCIYATATKTIEN
jgi:hypothetical protein